MRHHQMDQHEYFVSLKAEEREKGRKVIIRNIAKKFPNLGKEKDIQIQEP